MMSEYIGANVFCTGASRGIGLGLVRHLLAKPEVECVFAGARNPKEARDLQKLSATFPRLQIIEFDVLDDCSIESAAEEIGRNVGDKGLDLLINNAGLFLAEGNNYLKPKREAALQVLNTNFVGVMMTCPCFIPLLNKAAVRNGRPAKILNITSRTGSVSWITANYFEGQNATYPASKSALNSYIKFLSTSQESQKLIIIGVCPGFVKTDFNTHTGILSVDESVTAILNTTSKVTKEDTGRFMDRFGETINY